MQKISWVQWLVRIVKKDMNQKEEDSETKQEVYREVKQKSRWNTYEKGKML